MRKLLLGAAVGPLALALSACGGSEAPANRTAEASDSLETGTTGDTGAANTGGSAGTGTGASTGNGTIVEENGVRYRVDSGGNRVRVNADGFDTPDVDVKLPDVDVGINEKGNPDVDVRGKADVDVRAGNTSR